MYVGYFFAGRGAIKQEQRLATVSNNLANVSTPGFKRRRNDFQSFLVNEITTDYTQGSVKQTGRELDLALRGPGFFKVMTPTGPGYTREGSFTANQAGELVTSQGYQVMGEGGAINVGTDPSKIVVGPTGNITKNGEILGAIATVDMADKTHLKAKGDSVFSWDGRGQPDEVPAVEAEISQNHLELSNVNTINEMVHMIDTHRSFEAYTKALKSFHDIDQKATELGRLR